MTTINTDYQNTELLDQELHDDQLELVAGGGRDEDFKTMAPLVPIINGPINTISQWLGGPSIEVSL